MSTVHGGQGRIITDGLVLRLDAANPRSYTTGNSTWTDLSGNGYNGTLTNSPTFNSSNGGSIVFDGTNQYVISNLSKTIVGGTFTVSLWLYSTNNGSTGIFQFASGLNNTNPWILCQRTNSTTVRWYVYNTYRMTNTIINNLWYNLVLTYDSTTWRTYVNGVAAATDVNPIGGYSGTYLWIGNGYPTYFGGRISNFQVYTKTLSAAEVLQNYNATRARFGV